MRIRSGKLGTGKEIPCTVVVEPPLSWLETRDNWVTRGRVMFRGVLIWRTITAADVTTFGASAKMQPPIAGRQAFNTTCTARLG